MLSFNILKEIQTLDSKGFLSKKEDLILEKREALFVNDHSLESSRSTWIETSD